MAICIIRFSDPSKHAEVAWASISLCHLLGLSCYYVFFLKKYYPTEYASWGKTILTFFHLYFPFQAVFVSIDENRKSGAEIRFQFVEVLYEIPLQTLLQFYALQQFESSDSIDFPWLSVLICCITFGYKIAALNREAEPLLNLGFRKTEKASFLLSACEACFFSSDITVRCCSVVLLIDAYAQNEVSWTILIVMAFWLFEGLFSRIYDRTGISGISGFAQTIFDTFMSIATGSRLLNYDRTKYLPKKRKNHGT